MTRRKILNAALGEFAHHGFYGASMQSVSAAAGVANGTVYWHFESKSCLYLAVVRHASEEFHLGMAGFAAGPRTSFIDVVDREIEYRRENPKIDAILSSLRAAHPRTDPGEAERMREAARVVDGRLVDVWQRWIRARRWRGKAASNGEDLARLIASTVAGLLARRFIDPGMDVRAALSDFGRLLEDSLGKAA